MVQTTQITLRDRVQSIEDAISADRIKEATAHCQQLLARYPEALDIQRLLGEVYLAEGRLEEAQQVFDWILVNDPENIIVYCDRALICEHQSDIDTALDCYQQAYEISRGNSQIRQEFNNVSAKAGQQAFMLSRAGLARLYMRGNLLTQALQEWEAVLSVGPDRLDARLGLLETCWREGVYDEVERMASRILEEVPYCLKALLLLAHITSSYNMQRARDLVARAEMLDPEFLMAQDLFSDLASSHPHDPFLTLVKRAPIVLLDEEMNGHDKPIDAVGTLQYAAVEVAAESPSVDANADRIYPWQDKDNLSQLDTRSFPQVDPVVVSATPATPSPVSWSDESDNDQMETWAKGEAPSGQSAASEEEDWAAQLDSIGDFDSWATQHEIDDNLDPALLEHQPWFQVEPPEEDQQVPTPPAWLDMLTHSEQRKPAEPLQATSPASPASPTPPPAMSVEPAQPEALLEVEQEAPPEEEAPFFFASDSQEEDMGWPEWLKSLGAETIAPQEVPEVPEAPEVQQPAQSTDHEASDYMSALLALQTNDDSGQAGWLQSEQSAAHAEPVTPAQEQEAYVEISPEEAERQYYTTLETLEQSLMSQGFVPLQPGSLSAISQEVDSLPDDTLPSAPQQEEAQPVGEHELAQATSSIPPEQEQAAIPQQAFEPEQPMPVQAIQVEQSAQPALPIQVPQPVAQAPAFNADAFMDNELETTMRRPAVRLQPMQGTARHSEQLSLAGRGGPAERGAQAAENPLSNKERLVKGYQFQLAGAYDDAMQEYRLLIRNAPEHLGEVISNVRALLKLAPKYTAGYRVLGDAYMRQGEYLQAMEAYNKALTIAKNARSQVR